MYIYYFIYLVKEIKSFKFNVPPTCGDFFPDPEAVDIIIGDIDGNIHCCNLKNGSVNISLTPNDLNPKMKRLYSLININEKTYGCYEDGCIRIIDWTSGLHVDTINVNIGPTTDIIKCDNNTIAVSSHDKTIKTLSLETYKVIYNIPVYYIIYIVSFV